MQQLNSFLNYALYKAKIFGQVRVAMVISEIDKEINKILPERYRQPYKCLYIKDKILTIACLDLAVGELIKKSEKSIIYEVNKKFDQDVLKNFRIIPRIC